MTTSLQTIIYPVRDLARATALYSALLGDGPFMEEPYYVGFRTAGQDVGLNPRDHEQGMNAPVGYWRVDDVGGVLDRVVAVGATVRQSVTDVGGGKLMATLEDLDGNVIGLIQLP